MASEEFSYPCIAITAISEIPESTLRTRVRESVFRQQGVGEKERRQKGERRRGEGRRGDGRGEEKSSIETASEEGLLEG